jgi:hypothetical protein
MMAFGFLKDALGLAGAAVGVGSLFGMGRDKGSRQMNELASRQAAIAEALANPNSPMLQQARAQAMEQSRTAQLQALRDYMTQSQRQARRFQSGGRASFYAGSPRRDEAISRAMMQMGQNEAARADQAARAQLLGSAQAYGSALQGLGGVADRRAGAREQRMIGLASGLAGLGELGGRVPKVFGQTSPVQGSVNEPPAQRPSFTVGQPTYQLFR